MPAQSSHVWVVTQWVWGGGGDDDREIIAICTTEALAREIAAKDAERAVMVVPLDQERQPTNDATRKELEMTDDDDEDTRRPLAEAMAEHGWLMPKWGPDVLVAEFTAEQPNAEGWHRISAYVKRRSPE